MCLTFVFINERFLKHLSLNKLSHYKPTAYLQKEIKLHNLSYICKFTKFFVHTFATFYTNKNH